MLRKLLKTLGILIVIFTILIVITRIYHPIVLKWLVSKSARIIGKPVKAAVYTNGKINNEVKVYKVNKYWNGDEANYYLLHFTHLDTKKQKQVISVNIKDNYVGRPAGTSKLDYDVVIGQLFQSEAGAHFSTFDNEMKGYNFNPKLSFTEKQIKLNIPPAANLMCDSVRVEL